MKIQPINHPGVPKNSQSFGARIAPSTLQVITRALENNACVDTFEKKLEDISTLGHKDTVVTVGYSNNKNFKGYSIRFNNEKLFGDTYFTYKYTETPRLNKDLENQFCFQLMKFVTDEIVEEGEEGLFKEHSKNTRKSPLSVLYEDIEPNCDLRYEDKSFAFFEKIAANMNTTHKYKPVKDNNDEINLTNRIDSILDKYAPDTFDGLSDD